MKRLQQKFCIRIRNKVSKTSYSYRNIIVQLKNYKSMVFFPPFNIINQGKIEQKKKNQISFPLKRNKKSQDIVILHDEYIKQINPQKKHPKKIHPNYQPKLRIQNKIINQENPVKCIRSNIINITSSESQEPRDIYCPRPKSKIKKNKNVIAEKNNVKNEKIIKSLPKLLQNDENKMCIENQIQKTTITATESNQQKTQLKFIDSKLNSLEVEQKNEAKNQKVRNFSVQTYIDNNLKKNYKSNVLKSFELEYKLYIASNYGYLIEILLTQDYTKKQQIQQDIQIIPDVFQSPKQYTKIFQSLLIKQCVSCLRSEFQAFFAIPEKNSIKSSITFVKSTQKGSKIFQIKSEFFNKIFEIAEKKFMLVLISSNQNPLVSQYSINNYTSNSFLFLGYLQTSDNKKIELQCFINSESFKELIDSATATCVYIFEFTKISTFIKEFLAVRNIEFWDLCDYICNPSFNNFDQHHQKQISGVQLIFKSLQKHYNRSQYFAIVQIVLKRFGIIPLLGPPGTGKTYTILALIAAQLNYLKTKSLQGKQKIMICAPSNTAVDNIIKLILQKGLMTQTGIKIIPKMIRLGVVQSVEQCIKSITLQQMCKMQIVGEQERIQISIKLKLKLQNYLKQLQHLNNNNIQNCNRKLIEQKKSQIQKLENNINHIYSRVTHNHDKIKLIDIQKRLIKQADLIFVTLSSSSTQKLDNYKEKFACLIVDQATQCTQPNLLIPFKYNFPKVILVGDPNQLPPTTFSPEASKSKYQRSMFERLMKSGVKPYFLSIQYRMTPQIRSFISYMFYENRLIDDQSIKQRQYPKQIQAFKKQNIIFLDVKYGRQNRIQNSYYNKNQIQIIQQLLSKLNCHTLKIGIISPYRQQVKKLKQSLNSYQNITINTVDSFQGQEKDIIIISCVRSNSYGEKSEKSSLGFLVDDRRINVALTRSKFLVIVIGNADTLGVSGIWNCFLNYIQLKKSYIKINSGKQYKQIIDKLIKGSTLVEDRQSQRKMFSNNSIEPVKRSCQVYKQLEQNNVQTTIGGNINNKRIEEGMRNKESQIIKLYGENNVLESLIKFD